MNETLARTFRADPAEIRGIRTFIVDCVRGTPFADSLSDLLIAVSEAAANAILHSGTDEVRVTWSHTDQAARISVEDDGVFKRRVGIPEVDGVGHRGIQLMAATMDEVSIAEGRPDGRGTRVTLVKRAEGSAGGPYGGR